MGKLDGRTALVTGASRGIGKECARALDAEGARVALAARSIDDMEAIASDLTDAVVFSADMSDDGIGADLAVRAVEALGGADILINNAGISDQAGDDREMMQINFLAPLELTRSLANTMGERGHDAVVHMSSVASSIGVAETGTYGSTKAALDSLTRVQAAQFGAQGIRVNAVAPGLIVTDMWEAGREVPGLADGLQRHIPLGRWGTPSDIASVVTFLAGDDSRHITGQVITVDGGFRDCSSWENFLQLEDRGQPESST